VTTYGKTFHTWQYDRDDFPYGIPQLMMALTADGQLDEALVARRDRRLRLSSADRRRKRAGIPDPAVAPGADGWESGRTVQTCLVETDFKRPSPAAAASKVQAAAGRVLPETAKAKVQASQTEPGSGGEPDSGESKS
jgi:hypothetical protein